MNHFQHQQAPRPNPTNIFPPIPHYGALFISGFSALSGGINQGFAVAVHQRPLAPVAVPLHQHPPLTRQSSGGLIPHENQSSHRQVPRPYLAEWHPHMAPHGGPDLESNAVPVQRYAAQHHRPPYLSQTWTYAPGSHLRIAPRPLLSPFAQLGSSQAVEQQGLLPPSVNLGRQVEGSLARVQNEGIAGEPDNTGHGADLDPNIDYNALLQLGTHMLDREGALPTDASSGGQHGGLPAGASNTAGHGAGPPHEYHSSAADQTLEQEGALPTGAMDIERLSDDFADMLSARSSGGSVAAFEQIQGMLVEELAPLLVDEEADAEPAQNQDVAEDATPKDMLGFL
ncbi:g12672 [Coccomyxa viridis]|uniref:G12672 protein n=1 Tax=Coccomyxa viridis TaxID=1274662 RepID=A0ABP1GF20_9CHLO